MARELETLSYSCVTDSVHSAITADNYTCDVYTMQSEDDNHSLSRLQRPRGALARQLYDKILADQRLEDFDKNKWYECHLNEMPPHLASRFIQMGVDEGTEAFLEQSKEKSEWIFTQLWYSLARPFFGWFMSQTSVNGLLGRGSMFVFSKTQFLKLLGKDYQDSCQPIEFDKNLHFNGLVGGNVQELRDDSHQGNPCKTVLDIEPGPFFDGSLLDLGAGDGGITEIIAKMFKSGVYVTEISPPMKRTLAKKGFHVLDENSWHKEDIPSLRIAMCLNLLDRCETPLTLLSNLRDTLKKNAKEKPLLIVALVLPYSTYVEMGSSSDHKPKEIITIQGSTFEEQVVSVERDLFIPAGFEILQWTRLPYLCEGDLRQAYYWLSDSVFVLTPASDASDGNGDSNAS